MGVTTKVVMLLPKLQGEVVQHVNKWLIANDHREIGDACECAGGEKCFGENAILVGAFKGLDTAEFVAMLKEAPWDLRYVDISYVRVLIEEENDDRFYERFPNDEKGGVL